MEFLWDAIGPFLTQDWGRVIGDLPQIVVAGLAAGFQYALIAFGFVLIYRSTETINFAQGDIMMVSMFIAFAFHSLGLPWYINILLAVTIIGGFGAVLDLALFRHMAGQSPLATVIITIALGFILRNGVDMIFRPDEYPLPGPVGPDTVQVLGTSISIYNLLVVASALSLVAALFFFLSKTKVGIAIQAASQNQLAAVYQGISVRRLGTLVWGLSAAASGFAGMIFAMNPITFFNSSVGLTLTGGILAYAAAIIGGLDP